MSYMALCRSFNASSLFIKVSMRKSPSHLISLARNASCSPTGSGTTAPSPVKLTNSCSICRIRVRLRSAAAKWSWWRRLQASPHSLHTQSWAASSQQERRKAITKTSSLRYVYEVIADERSMNAGPAKCFWCGISGTKKSGDWVFSRASRRMAVLTSNGRLYHGLSLAVVSHLLGCALNGNAQI